MSTLVFESPAAMNAWSIGQQLLGERVALVPTMGALHEGHFALIDEAHRQCDVVVVSIFVNPLQFNRRDDFEQYPRPGDDDLEHCSARHVAAVYAPTADTMYPAGFDTHVEPGRIGEVLEGAGRPGHFRGVATVITKLFNAVRPHVAVFGEKDFQQLNVVRQMTIDLDLAISIVGVPTVRDSDGLALSSRNRRLSSAQRVAATVVPAALTAMKSAYASGNTSALELCEIAAQIVRREPLAHLEYIDIIDASDPLTSCHGDILRPASRAVIAAWFGDIRLIDNVELSI